MERGVSPPPADRITKTPLSVMSKSGVMDPWATNSDCTESANKSDLPKSVLWQKGHYRLWEIRPDVTCSYIENTIYLALLFGGNILREIIHIL